MSRLRPWVTLVIGVLLLAGLVGAQEAKKDTPAKPKGVLPPAWAKIGLTDEQKTNIYKVQSEYQAKIDELKQQIEKLDQQKLADMRKVLTEAQRTKLREILLGPDEKPPPDKKPEEKKPE